ncbi:MAG: penicillin-binding protein 2 [Bacteroidales bacterium]|nr:penicillin-binding protein 2 [Candidatus Liminaster caballi]
MQHDFKLERRKYVIGALVVVIILIYIVRLFSLQVLEDKYKDMARDNAFYNRTIYPARGIIYDRQGRELVYNQPAHDLMVTMRSVKNLDTLAFCQMMGMTRERFNQRMTEIKDRSRNPGYSSYTPQTFATQILGDEYARISESLHRFDGFDTSKRTIRQYKYAIAPHILGNIREVSPKELKADKDNYYRRGDFVGDMGVEKTYEKFLRGKKGKELLLRDAHGRIKGHYENGKYDVAPVPGNDITLTIDAELQAYAESLMGNKIGALVAIEPKTGEILAMVSSPTFDPRLLVGNQRGKNYNALVANPYRPLYDRAVSASYPPGSTFKPTQGLIGLQDGAITPNTVLNCNHGFRFGNFKMGCHDGVASWTIVPAIATSCNGYFGWCLVKILENKKYATVQDAFEQWKNYMVSMGYGYKLGVDIPGETRGFIPNRAYYSKAFRTDKWKPINIISISIGQGEILATPLQIANLAATIANRGYYYIPHVIKHIAGYEQIPDTFLQPHRTMVDSVNYEWVVQGMRQAAVNGTVWRAGNMDAEGIELCGKTGTAQNPHGKDHSVFMGFAPMDDPKIAVCCFVENGGFGAVYGVPIGTLVIEKYINGEISDRRKWQEQNMLNASTMQNMGAYKKK